MEDRLHVIGDIQSPVLICKKGEIAGFFNTDFYKFYHFWKYFHYGFGLPKKWDELDPDFADIIIMMEAHYERNFSMSNVAIKYMETILKVLANRPSL